MGRRVPEGPLLVVLLAVVFGCQKTPSIPVWHPADPPAAAGALAPRWTGGPGLSWLEPDGEGHRLLLAYRTPGGWSAPEVVHEGEGFFANWADLPAVLHFREEKAGTGTRVATWLESVGQGTYAYGVRLAASTAPAAGWQPLGWLHEDDSSETEHGFVSLLSSSPGAWAFWLDGRTTSQGGPMSLRAARLAPEPETSSVLDDRVCDCCQTGAAMTSDGPVVVYRDRSIDEIRDISLVRFMDGRWTEPRTLYKDGWQIQGCPVNGPAIAADDRRVAVAWFSNAKAPRVQVIFSQDAAATFLAPVTVDDHGPMGRVDVALLPGGDALVSWLGTTEAGAAVQVRRVSAQGSAGPSWVVAPASSARRSGFPRLLVTGEEVLVSWIDATDSSRLRVSRLSLLDLPQVPAI